MKEKNQTAVTLGRLAADRLRHMTPEEKSEYMSLVRQGKKLNKIRPLRAVDK